MRITSLALFIAGIILLIYGFNASDSVSSAVSETVTGTPTDKSMLLIILGVIALLSGCTGIYIGRSKN